MGQVLGSVQEQSAAQAAVGSLLYSAMLKAGALPDVAIDHTLLSNPESLDSRARLQDHLRQLQGHVGNRAPTYLKELISRLVAFSDEPKLAALVGLVISMVAETAYASSRGSAGSGGCQIEKCRAELQDIMEEYLKRCRMHLNDEQKLKEDTQRLEGQLSYLLTQLKNVMLREGPSSKGLKHWASGAAFHTQMLLHLTRLEQRGDPLVVQAAMEQYQEDFKEILPVYKQYKASTVTVIKCRGGLRPGEDPLSEGSVTGFTLVDRELGRSVRVPLPEDAPFGIDLIPSDVCAQAYLEHLFSHQGPIAELERYFINSTETLSQKLMLREPTDPNERLSVVETEPLERRENLNTTTANVDFQAQLDKRTI
ncbi:uncharacterized protein LOC105021442 isoform X2 [Esox lucius]|nr:uncharacterized protein LOC105021442 isoform X2 [Esox lucius]XP_010887425.1 uncharacterized protein LOC105021442 isoform X2 [Esox lucius]